LFANPFRLTKIPDPVNSWRAGYPHAAVRKIVVLKKHILQYKLLDTVAQKEKPVFADKWQLPDQFSEVALAI